MNKAIKHLLIIVSLFFLATCGSGPHHGSGTGAISFNLKWNDSTSASSPYASLSPSGNVCLDYGIDTISAEVYSSNANVASESWPCSAREGTISNVPVGSGMRVEIKGSVSGEVRWSGEASNISVTVDQTTIMDSITMNYTGPDSELPIVSSTNPTNEATAIAINTSISVTFDNQMVWSSDGTPTFFTVKNGSIDIPGTVTYDSDTYTVTFTPGSDLSYVTTYTITITSDVEDIGGNNMTAPYIWRFTTMPGLPDSGQVGDYTQTYGEDGDYKINTPSYTDNSNETVTDNITGLMWQQQDDDTPRSWDDGVTYCNDLTLADLTDWRLPSRRELSNIVDFGTNSPAIDTTIFPGTDSSYYWSSTENASDLLQASPIDFSGNFSYSTAKSTLYYVRCVRGAQFPNPSFNDNGDGTVTDSVTGLVWQQGEDGGSATLDSVLTYCEGLSLSTYSDWRLPNVKELESIVDLTKTTGPGIDTTYFPGAVTYWYATSTTYDQNSTYIWVVSFNTGSGGNGISYGVGPYNIRCVRGGTDGDNLPFADASDDQRAVSGVAVQLDGSGSSDSDGDSIAYTWSFTSVPAGSTAAFNDSAIVNPTFTADVAGAYVISLVVNDGTLNSVADLVTVTAFLLPDTGQTANYTATFGEDSDYTINPPSYTDNGDGTVMDNNTGLMWQQADDGVTYDWYQASGTYDVTYNPDVSDVCGNLSLGGYSDWRLPSKKELITIVDYGVYSPAINSTYFKANASDYWSSTTYAGYASSAWFVSFNYAYVYYVDKTYNYYIRCVR